ncbi:hypothetical protein PVAND_015520 [Polypedilum vanderplanki]|uniref:Uncharacterized protein n=1 Tax=Polypedilum vanderplanki TaxID=319348 RepID=A0A9J6BCT5_POLVA|nr:hypothetical protein PVAND_015520 [Polypedilum vanderplanki]
MVLKMLNLHEPVNCCKQRTTLEKYLIAIIIFLTLAAIGLFVGLIIVSTQNNNSDEMSNVCLTKGCIMTANTIIQNMKSKLNPCDDFYEFACGRFIESTIIPDDKTEVSAFTKIDDDLKNQLRLIINEPIIENEIKPFKDLKLLNQACLNLTEIENIGVNQIMKKIETMRDWPVLKNNWNDSQWKWEEIIAKMKSFGDSNNHIFAFAIDQTELGLDYKYLIERDENALYLAYKEFQIDLVELFGSNLTRAEIEEQMGKVLEFEYKLANISLPNEERRNFNLLYNPMSIIELQSKYPYIQWLDYLNSLMPDDTKFTENDIIINGAPTFFEKLGSILENTPNEVKANYLMWRFVLDSVEFLSQKFRNRHQEFIKATTGKEKENSRALTCTNVILNFFSHALGSLYVRKHFKEEAKENVMEMVANLKVAFKEILDEIDWMDENTKKAAHDKADAMKSQMAYADELLDDTKLVEYYQNIDAEIDVNNYYESIGKLNLARTNFAYRQLREIVDKDHWTNFATPAVVNAYYSPIENTIKFPAAILQGAFFNFNRPHYMNYGAIGWVIGHEITHGFDDQGSRFDLNGNLQNWWRNQTRNEFESRAKCIINQYSNYKDEQTGLNLNGINTQGENIADNGGIKESYRAYEKLIEKIGAEKLLPGIKLNQRQLFWVSAAQIWCNVQRDEMRQMQIYTDFHSPGKYRVIGSMSNRPEFSKDFNCIETSVMNSNEKCSVWKLSWTERTSLEKILIFGVFFLITVAVCLTTGLILVAIKENNSEDTSNICFTEGCIYAANALNQNMKPDLDPCDDFYEYACGRFLEEQFIPDDKTDITSFSESNDILQNHLRQILNEPIKETEIKPFKDLKLLNKACLNLTKIEERGISPIMNRIIAMGGWPVLFNNWDDSNWSWQKVIEHFRNYGYSVNQIFTFGVTIDSRNSTRRIAMIDQTSLGLSYEYIMKRESDKIYLAYKDYQIDLAKLFGSTLTREQLNSKMGEALDFEYKLANISLPREERRNANLLYNPMSITELQSKYPYIQWLDYLNSLMPEDTKFTENDIIINAVPTFFEKLGQLLEATPNEVKANYLMWRFAASSVSYMPKIFRDRDQEFDRITTGKETPDPRGRECADITLGYFQHALGSLYVRKHFKEDAKKNVVEMVENLKMTFEEMLKEVDWMKDQKTKEAALKKIDLMKSQMAYADELLNDEKLIEYYNNFDVEIDVENYYESVTQLQAASTRFGLRQLRKKVDKNDWTLFVLPAVVNAYYLVYENTIQFPAGILTGSFFKADRPHYMNYGAIGFVIGHEITHGFDDQGSLFDAYGNLNNWWDNATKTEFEKRAQCIINQYSKYKDDQTGLNLNGINTQGENIADNGGIKESYRAYEKLIEKIGEEKLLPGIRLNQRQLFWVSAAQIWCNIQRDEAMRNKILTDPHSPGKFRVIGSMSNRPEFARDFKCSKNSKMNPPDNERCSVW